jgi:hypothetical protein
MEVKTLIIDCLKSQEELKRKFKGYSPDCIFQGISKSQLKGVIMIWIDEILKKND